MERSSETQRHILVRRGTPTEVAVVPHIAHLDDDLQSDRENMKAPSIDTNMRGTGSSLPQ